jgi:hypothetical protein
MEAVAETYSVLTRLPGDARVSAADAARLLDENFAPAVVLSARATRVLHRECARRDGGATYDALAALAVRENGLRLATRCCAGAFYL